MDPIQVLPMDQEDGQPEQLDEKASYFKESSGDGLPNFDNINKTIAIPKQMVLIKFISEHPAIYDSKHNDYRNFIKKDALWSTISQRVGWPESYCKNKWKAIRDQFCREMKRSRENPKMSIKWKYFTALQFLRPYALSRHYRPKTNRSSNAKDHQESLENSLISSVKTENWNLCDNSSQINECSDITSDIIIQISQSESKLEPAAEEEPQEDEDDDPIHTFLNIESYFEKELMSMVKSEEVLYNTQHPSYRNAKVKSKTWEEISRKLKKPVRNCRLKWKALRDQYIREHKRLKGMNRGHVSPTNGKISPRWKHYNELSFLQRYVRQRNDYNFVAIEKPLNQERMKTPRNDDDHEMTQYLLGDDETSEVLTEGLYSRDSIEEQNPAYMEDYKISEPPVIEETEAVRETHAPKAVEDDDEVGTFFKAVAIKIRKANMTAMNFTNLQIDILKVINNALRNH